MPQSLADILKDPCFNVASLTESIKLLPNTFSKVGQSGIFKGKGINTRTVAIEYARVASICWPTRTSVVRGSEPNVTRATSVTSVCHISRTTIRSCRPI
ncbi:major capsid protein [Paludibacterium denitrificans]|uniref:major capsid protein n=1 Tax=Paludibacterium denitrificans TaxID=2675226 RepID=UPI001E5ADCC7|nr:major capsid protein [Paludibacterium denitrificans]